MPEANVKSLPAAAFALARGARLLRCEISQPGPVDFIFEDPRSGIAATARAMLRESELARFAETHG